MNRSHKLDCIVLKSFDLNEADRVLTAFSKEQGKVSIIAKGVKRVVSRKAGSVEVGNHSILFVASGANFLILQEAQVRDSYEKCKTQLSTLKYVYYVLELIDKLVPENESHEDVFRLLLEIMSLLNNSPRKIFIRAFEIKLLNKLGFLTVRAVDLDKGSISGAEYLSAEASQILEDIQNMNWQQINDMDLDEDAAERVRLFLEHRIRLVAEREIKSLGYFE